MVLVALWNALSAIHYLNRFIYNKHNDDVQGSVGSLSLLNINSGRLVGCSSVFGEKLFDD